MRVAPPLGLGIVQLLSAPMKQVENRAARVLRKARIQLADSDLGPRVVQLVERLLMSRFPQFDREEVRMKFKLHDIRESKVWKEAHEEGAATGLKTIIDTLLGKGKTLEEIAELLDIPLGKVRRVANDLSTRGSGL